MASNRMALTNRKLAPNLHQYPFHLPSANLAKQLSPDSLSYSPFALILALSMQLVSFLAPLSLLLPMINRPLPHYSPIVSQLSF